MVTKLRSLAQYAGLHRAVVTLSSIQTGHLLHIANMINQAKTRDELPGQVLVGSPANVVLSHTMDSRLTLTHKGPLRDQESSQSTSYTRHSTYQNKINMSRKPQRHLLLWHEPGTKTPLLLRHRSMHVL
jgi:hypothetical protein